MFQKTKRSIQWIRHSDQTKLPEVINYNNYLTFDIVLYGCDVSLLSNKNFLTSTIFSSLFEGKMTLLDFLLHKFKGGGEGITAMAILGSSHLAVSTFPELGTLTINLQTCSGSPFNLFHTFLRKFKPSHYEYTLLPTLTYLKRKKKEEIIINESLIKEDKLREWLIQNKLFNLSTSSQKFLVLTYLLGFIFGDGHLHKDFNSICVYQKDGNELEVLKKHLEDVGIDSVINLRLSKAKRSVYELSINNRKFVKFMYLLGAPRGSKTTQELRLPDWLRKIDRSIKAFFLASLFLSELTKPKFYLNRGATNAYIQFGLATQKKYEKSLINFLKEIAQMAKEFNIKSNSITKREEYDSKDGRKVKYVINFSNSNQNFIRIQALLSLSKIYPFKLMDFNFNFGPDVKLSKYQKNSEYEKIIEFLMGNNSGFTTEELAKKIDLSPQNLHKWLKKLELAGIIINRKSGSNIVGKSNARYNLWRLKFQP
jgi:S-adenosylmethionine/arginine decarboxylase-like enzyme